MTLEWLTPEEAKELWCPSSITRQDGVAVNRLDAKSKENSSQKCKCIAEECANWEWLAGVHEKGRCAK